jgi:SanA protein
MKKNRKIKVLIILLTAIVLFTIFYCDNQVQTASEGKLYSSLDKIPPNHAGILLGTAKYLSGGYLNPYYKYRIDAAVQLVKAGKVKFLIVSGDNGRTEYNEPEMMKADLIAAGVDSNRIYLDFAGFRTFDSMIRLKKIFSQNSVTIISQEFHNQRAMFIAQKEGIAAVGYNARDVPKNAGVRMQVREKFARVKLFADYLFEATPKFLGPKVQIPD